MRKMKAGVALAMVALMAAQVFAAGAQDPKAAQKPIEFWTPFTGPDGVNMTKMVEEYNKTNPAIPVVHMPIKENDFYPKIPTIVGSGKNVPDLTIVHVDRIAQFVENGMLLPLDDAIKSNGNIQAADYVKNAWDMGVVAGKRYSLPLDVHSFVLYYNKDLVAKYGPKVLDDGVVTFQEVEEVSKRAKADGIVGMGITWMRVKFLGWYAQLGGTLGNAKDEPAFNNDKAAKVLNTVKDLHDKGYTTIDGDDPGQLFRSGKMVFWPEGIWMINSLKEIPDLKFGMAQTIVFDPKVKGNWTSSHQFVSFKNPNMTPARAKGVMDFINWVGANSIEWARAGQVPASLKILNNPEFQTMPQAFLLKEPESLAITNYKYYGYAVEALDKIVLEVPFGRMQAKAALDQAVKETADRIRNQ